MKNAASIEIKNPSYDLQPSPFGTVYLALQDDVLVGCSFSPIADWRNPSLTYHPAQLEKFALIAQQIGQACHSVQISPAGTPFQKTVWQALLNIPYGETRSYQDIADTLGQPKAVRALANAIGANPISWFIPCHRVIRRNGELGGYAWGASRKQQMLNWEQNHQ